MFDGSRYAVALQVEIQFALASLSPLYARELLCGEGIGEPLDDHFPLLLKLCVQLSDHCIVHRVSPFGEGLMFVCYSTAMSSLSISPVRMWTVATARLSSS